VSGAPEGLLRVEALDPHHDRRFASGAEPLDRYLRNRAGQDARKKMAVPFVLVLPDGAIGGYYTLSATGVKLTEFPVDITRKLPRYPLVPATLLGRLAADQTYQGRGYGRFLLADALCFAQSVARSHRSPSSSTRRMTHPATSMSARAFCRFRKPLKLFRSMADIAKLYE
jgi:GNAT superfamily N-acetyltransferase